MSTPTPVPVATLFNPKIHAHLLPAIAALHATCILSPPYTTATFLPPLSHDRMLNWWEARAAEVERGERFILFVTAPSTSSPDTSSRSGEIDIEVENSEEVLQGYVSLAMPATETGPFRGSVEKLLVRPEARGRGVARVLMRELERQARGRGRTALTLDTEKGSPAEIIYPRLAWTKLGEIPNYGISPKDGTLKAAVWFYKDLNAV